MAKIELPRYLVEKGRDPSKLYYWQPSKALHDAGWQTKRLARGIADPAARLAAAIAEANAQNTKLDANRSGALPLTAPARGSRSKPEAGTVDDLIAAFKASRFWIGLRNTGAPVLAPKTKLEYGKALGLISEWIGPDPVTSVTAEDVNAFYEPYQAKAPAMANFIMRVGRLLWNRGKVLRNLTVNPFKQLGLIGLEFTGQIWPQEAVAIFVQAADELGLRSIGTAIALDHWIGQREADVLGIPEAVHENIALIQAKTRAGVDLPIGAIDALTARIAKQIEWNRGNVVALKPAAEPQRRPLLRSELTGERWNEDSFRHQFAAVRLRAAELRPSFEVDYIIRGRDPEAADARTVKTKELKFMWLRHTAVTRLAEAGCTDLQISAITRHSESSAKQIRERYVIRTGTMAREAFALRLAHEKKQGVG